MFESNGKPIRRLIRNERGVALVEFALIAPLLFIVLFAVLDFGKAFNYWNNETQLAAQGARLAAVTSSAPGNCPNGTAPSNLAAYLQCNADTGELRNGGTTSVPTKARVCISFPNATSNVGDPVKVTMAVTYFWLPFLGNQIGVANTTIAGTATMRLEQAWASAGQVCS
jgi:Flp pilus assembly protein TadG